MMNLALHFSNKIIMTYLIKIIHLVSAKISKKIPRLLTRFCLFRANMPWYTSKIA